MRCMIERLRVEKNVTQSQLADACGVSQQNISKIENGHGTPSLALALAIAKTLGCTVDDLYADEPKGEVG